MFFKETVPLQTPSAFFLLKTWAFKNFSGPFELLDNLRYPWILDACVCQRFPLYGRSWILNQRKTPLQRCSKNQRQKPKVFRDEAPSKTAEISEWWKNAEPGSFLAPKLLNWIWDLLTWELGLLAASGKHLQSKELVATCSGSYTGIQEKSVYSYTRYKYGVQ